jgi:hypothetical protein
VPFRLMLSFHNIFRWVVILALAWGLLRAFAGWLGAKPWIDTDRRAGMLLTIAYDMQFLLGLILALISPTMASAFSDLNAAMQVEELRFFAVEHMPLMILALIVGHLTSTFSRKAVEASNKHRRAALGYAIVGVMTIVAMPWFRPWLRF